MLWTILAVLIVLWLLGLVGGIGGSLIHALLVFIAAVILVVQLLTGRRLSRFSSTSHQKASFQLSTAKVWVIDRGFLFYFKWPKLVYFTDSAFP